MDALEIISNGIQLCIDLVCDADDHSDEQIESRSFHTIERVLEWHDIVERANEMANER